MKGKTDKDIAIARISARQAIVVAVITFCSAVAVATFTNLSKGVATPSGIAEMVGFSSGRATAVDQALVETEKEIQEKRDAALSAGNTLAVAQLDEVKNDIRAVRAKVQQLHRKKMYALKDGKLLEASEITLEANEIINDFNDELFATRGRRHKNLDLILSSCKPIPLYGRGLSGGNSTEENAF